jgi:hypothetical protein
MYNFFQIAKLLESWGFSKNKILHTYAKSQVGKKLSGVKADISVGCVEAFLNVFNGCFGWKPTESLHTATLYKALSGSIRFRKLDIGEVAQDGDIILAVTGSGLQGKVGHVGIFDGTKIMSNNSLTGIWDTHIDIGIWIKRYIVDYHMPLHIFRVLW